MKVPTTHDHPDGVAAGIVAGLERLLREHAIDPASVTFIAHSTTQATNALLEGDVARVGVVRFGSPFARASMRFAPIPLAAGITLDVDYLDARDSASDAWFERARVLGIDAFAAGDAFAVDRPERENAFVADARAHGLRRDVRQRSFHDVRTARAHAHGRLERGDSPAHAAHRANDAASR